MKYETHFIGWRTGPNSVFYLNIIVMDSVQLSTYFLRFYLRMAESVNKLRGTTQQLRGSTPTGIFIYWNNEHDSTQVVQSAFVVKPFMNSVLMLRWN